MSISSCLPIDRPILLEPPKLIWVCVYSGCLASEMTIHVSLDPAFLSTPSSIVFPDDTDILVRSKHSTATSCQNYL